MSQYFPEPREHSGRNVKVGLALSCYTKKVDLKGATGIDRSILALETDVASLKTKVGNLDVDKLQIAHAGLNKLSNVVDNDVVKKTV